MTTSTPHPGMQLDGTPRRLDPRVRTQWAIGRSILWFVLAIAFVIGGIASNQSGLAVFGALGGFVLIALAVGSASLSFRYWSWAAHDDAIEIQHGVIMRHLSVVPYHRIQQIDIKRDPLERMLGISTLVLRSAAATTDARLPGINADETEALRHALLARAGVDDAV